MIHCGTFSKEHTAFGIGFPEKFIAVKGGAEVLLSDGRVYVDTVLGLGAYPLGYVEMEYSDLESLRHGIEFTLPDVLWETVRALARQFLDVEEVHPVRTGSDACFLAVKLARAVRPGKVLMFEGNYHGQHLQPFPPHRGSLLDFSQLVVVDRHAASTWPKADELSCVIAEFPVVDEYPDGGLGWGAYIVHLQKAGVVFIADEVITACRFPGNLAFRKSAGFPKPDLICAGKGLSNGYGFYVIGGRADILKEIEPPDPVFISSTYAGDTAALRGAARVMSTYPNVGNLLWEVGHALRELLLPEFFRAGSPIRIMGQPTRFIFRGDTEVLAAFRACCAERGLLVNRPFFVCLQHLPLLAIISNVLNTSLEVILSGEYRIPRELPQPIFRER